jgi:hypothetical protein
MWNRRNGGEAFYTSTGVFCYYTTNNTSLFHQPRCHALVPAKCDSQFRLTDVNELICYCHWHPSHPQTPPQTPRPHTQMYSCTHTSTPVFCPRFPIGTSQHLRYAHACLCVRSTRNAWMMVFYLLACIHENSSVCTCISFKINVKLSGRVISYCFLRSGPIYSRNICIYSMNLYFYLYIIMFSLFVLFLFLCQR